ncbi:hypothetical protein ACFYUR_18545 [Micromonospora haikouensis]|uniref:hypothetical protein n=1 Tax=Micromonospora haikouensis TaxID=686309 RepID=UPI00367A9A95
MTDTITADRYADDTRAAYLAAYPVVRASDIPCLTCRAESRRSCLDGGQSVPAHPLRVADAGRISATRLTDADHAADAARSIHAQLACGTPADRVARHVRREGRRAFLMAYGWRPFYCTDSSPWRSPYTPIPYRHTFAQAFAWVVGEHAVFLGPEPMLGVCVSCRRSSDGVLDRFGVPRCVMCADTAGVAA